MQSLGRLGNAGVRVVKRVNGAGRAARKITSDANRFGNSNTVKVVKACGLFGGGAISAKYLPEVYADYEIVKLDEDMFGARLHLEVVAMVFCVCQIKAKEKEIKEIDSQIRHMRQTSKNIGLSKTERNKLARLRRERFELESSIVVLKSNIQRKDELNSRESLNMQIHILREQRNEAMNAAAESELK